MKMIPVRVEALKNFPTGHSHLVFSAKTFVAVSDRAVVGLEHNGDMPHGLRLECFSHPEVFEQVIGSEASKVIRRIDNPGLFTGTIINKRIDDRNIHSVGVELTSPAAADGSQKNDFPSFQIVRSVVIEDCFFGPEQTGLRIDDWLVNCSGRDMVVALGNVFNLPAATEVGFTDASAPRLLAGSGPIPPDALHWPFNNLFSIALNGGGSFTVGSHFSMNRGLAIQRVLADFAGTSTALGFEVKNTSGPFPHGEQIEIFEHENERGLIMLGPLQHLKKGHSSSPLSVTCLIGELDADYLSPLRADGDEGDPSLG
jgi:hypothetical protein